MSAQGSSFLTHEARSLSDANREKEKKTSPKSLKQDYLLGINN